MNELHPSCESGICDIVKELQATSTIFIAQWWQGQKKKWHGYEVKEEEDMDNVKIQNIKNKNDENKGARDKNKEEPIVEEDKDEGDHDFFFPSFTN